MMCMDDAVGNCKAEAGSVRLVRDERLEDRRKIFLADAAAVIGNADMKL